MSLLPRSRSHRLDNVSLAGHANYPTPGHDDKAMQFGAFGNLDFDSQGGFYCSSKAHPGIAAIGQYLHRRPEILTRLREHRQRHIPCSAPGSWPATPAILPHSSANTKSRKTIVQADLSRALLMPRPFQQRANRFELLPANATRVMLPAHPASASMQNRVGRKNIDQVLMLGFVLVMLLDTALG